MSYRKNTLIKTSIGRKIVMALSGLFLISFLIVHASINALIFYNDNGEIFGIGAHFMATNPIIRTIEVFLIIGFIIHIIQGYMLWYKNKKARPVGYAVNKNISGVTWYSKSMTLLGTLLLLFLVIHTRNFWIPNRIHQFQFGEELPLYKMMIEKFTNPVEVVIYLIGCSSLAWHLAHGFQSAFRSLGGNPNKFNSLILNFGYAFAIIIPLTLAMMPISIYVGWIK
ncbi:succinate dehydrogenase cytochrome b subunit [Chryseobacterium paludis]|uniref:succinate dehydrogenase cytochrome b subunit n=1 Tax=Chryseobacterium paludis TaxID=2956784 RepID=UPI0021BE947A|nr:succinate dehydrogenase cytochrome b subunit [Chryseobacterium paludis]